MACGFLCDIGNFLLMQDNAWPRIAMQNVYEIMSM